jgi:hypothetical protein
VPAQSLTRIAIRKRQHRQQSFSEVTLSAMNVNGLR